MSTSLESSVGLATIGRSIPAFTFFEMTMRKHIFLAIKYLLLAFLCARQVH